MIAFPIILFSLFGKTRLELNWITVSICSYLSLVVFYEALRFYKMRLIFTTNAIIKKTLWSESRIHYDQVTKILTYKGESTQRHLKEQPQTRILSKHGVIVLRAPMFKDDKLINEAVSRLLNYNPSIRIEELSSPPFDWRVLQRPFVYILILLVILCNIPL